MHYAFTFGRLPGNFLLLRQDNCFQPPLNLEHSALTMAQLALAQYNPVDQLSHVVWPLSGAGVKVHTGLWVIFALQTNIWSRSWERERSKRQRWTITVKLQVASPMQTRTRHMSRAGWDWGDHYMKRVTTMPRQNNGFLFWSWCYIRVLQWAHQNTRQI